MSKEKPAQGTIEAGDNGQIAFGFILVDESSARPDRISDIGVTGYQDLYHRLCEQGWKWQKAAFMAWRAAPRDSRQPKTQVELAEMLGYASDKVFRNWLDKPQQGLLMAAIISQSPRLVFETHLADVDYVTISQAKRVDSAVNERDLFYKRYREIITGAGEDQLTDDDYGHLSDEEIDDRLNKLLEQTA
jgi:hypothetical protein